MCASFRKTNLWESSFPAAASLGNLNAEADSADSQGATLERPTQADASHLLEESSKETTWTFAGEAQKSFQPLRAWAASGKQAGVHGMQEALSEHERYHGLGMGASPTVCSRNTNVIMVWAWPHWQPCALGTRTLSWFGHGRIANRMLSEHERYHGLGMDALATVCSWNTNVIMVWAWPHWQPCALGTRTLSWFGHGRIANRMLSEQERYHGLGMAALATLCSWNTNVIMVWAWPHREPYALGTGTLSWFGHGRIGNPVLLEHERYHGLGMDALATVCSWNTNVIMVWAWAHRQPYALGTRTLSWFGHGRIGNPVLSEHERYHGLGMGASPTVCSRNTNVIMVWAWPHWQPCPPGTRTLAWFGHGRIGNRMLSEHERYHGLGMDALATVCSRNTNIIMVWAWPHWQPCALGTRTLSWFGHGRSGKRMLLLLAVP